MEFEIRKTKQKSDKRYKSLYLAANLIKQIDDIAVKHHTSFNNVIVSMIEYCLDEDEK